MLRSKALSEKVIFLGIDGMDPRFSRKMIENGKMPNLAKLMERGSARDDLKLLGAVPTITPPMWTTLCTGAYPMTHGIEDFMISELEDIDVHFSGVYSNRCHAEQLWNCTVEAGKKTVVWHWPGSSWPPTSDNPNLIVVDGTSAGALGCNYAVRDSEMIACASVKAKEAKFHMFSTFNTENLTGIDEELVDNSCKFGYQEGSKKEYADEFWEEFKKPLEVNGLKLKRYNEMRTSLLMPGGHLMEYLRRVPVSVSLSPITPAEGWANAPVDAKEFVIFYMYGAMQRPCLILKDETGKYSKVAIYASKDAVKPLGVLEKDVFTEHIFDVVPKGKSGEVERVTRNMRVIDLDENGDFVRMWVSNAMTLEDAGAWWPQHIFHSVMEKVGPMVPTGMLSGGDIEVMKCNEEQWRAAAKWQADALKLMIEEEKAEVIFSHYHGPDMSGHMYMQYLKERKAEPESKPEEEIYALHEMTYQITDEYIGEFLPLIDEGWTILLFSDHSLICRNEDSIHDIGDNYAINVGVMQKLGYTVMKKDENGNDTPDVDWEKTRAVAVRSNSIFINLKGRNRFGIVDPADQYELEEQIITDLYKYTDEKTGHRVVTLALHKKDANLLGVGGEYTGADIIYFLHDDYLRDHGESLSTAVGYADTCVGPIFAAAGPGIKEGYRMQLFPREVDLAPTAAVLLGVRIPAQCEGAPMYSILSEEL